MSEGALHGASEGSGEAQVEGLRVFPLRTWGHNAKVKRERKCGLR